MQSVGWIGVDAEGKPTRNTWRRDDGKPHKQPIKVYKTEARAVEFSKEGGSVGAVEVFMYIGAVSE